MPNHQQKKHKYRNQGDLYKKKKSLFTVKVYLYIKTAKIKLKKKKVSNATMSEQKAFDSPNSSTSN